MSNTAAVVVTYNRKLELISALEAIFNQSELPKKLFIIDNKSTDGTPQHLLDNNVLSALPRLDSDADEHHFEVKQIDDTKQIEICYVRKAENNGGAGGFYKGMKLAYEGGFDWIWMMDDDGVPHKDQLGTLISVSEKNKYFFSNALLINIDEREKLAFGLKGYDLVTDIKEKDVIEDFVNPFNGTLVHKSVIQKVGLIKEEMFIWGDEKEYMLRVKFAGYTLVTVLDALHYHPKIKGNTVNAFPMIKGFSIVLKPEKMAHFYYRNLGYIEQQYATRKVRFTTKMSYTVYFLRKFQFSNLLKFVKSYSKGQKDDFSTPLM